jgi:hypothetical protein
MAAMRAAPPSSLR